MSRVKRGKIKTQKRKALLKKTKGYRGKQKSHKRAAKEAITHAGRNAYRDRKRKKRETRRHWQIIIGAALGEHNLSYSQFTHLLKENEVAIDRKMLAELAQDRPAAFNAVVATVTV
ncbi:MAG: 50S ribosomal protein L20 [Candidatus Paceibacterota bacterium]